MYAFRLLNELWITSCGMVVSLLVRMWENFTLMKP
jgi:hypothetical protein